jgi:1-acyl-sn-glycerol-3-phosphate acyltransferase
MLLSIRSALFYAGYALMTIVWGTLGTLTGWVLPYRIRFLFIVGCWTRMCLWWLRVTCRIDHEIQGLHNLPQTPCIVLSRHESTWETLFLQTVFAPQATLIKRELLWIPFFGWAFMTLRPIAIDRSDGRKALRQLIEEGRRRLAQGIWVVLFPEGTRLAAGSRGRLQPGGAAIAAATGTPVLVVAHNAGTFWPARAFLKYPGTIRAVISEPIDTTGLSTKQIQHIASERLDRLMS